MNLQKLILINNNCYIAGKKITPKGIMVHSTGANNPNLKRYVGPDDGKLGVNAYNNHWNTNLPGGREVCVHGFIGKLADGSIATYQTLPWDQRGWHAGGSANNTHIGFEICEDGLTDAEYFKKVYQEAAELCAYLCKQYNLDPLKDGVIICHSEGYKRGVASNHGDVMHWFPKHGKSMDTFRSDVSAIMKSSDKQESSTQEPTAKTYVLKVKVKGYSNSADAKARKNAKTSLAAGTYYIFSKYPNGYNGMMNITKDKTGKVPGSWINPNDNKLVEWNPSAGDKVIVNGVVSEYGSGKGNNVTMSNRTMYITEVLNANIYPHNVGVSLKKGSARYGWVKRSSIKKA